MIIAPPLVTIGLPIYNSEKTLADAISSLINQSYSNWELLLLDDGSTDGSKAVAEIFSDPRVRWMSDGTNKGISYRLNQAVDMAKGEYFCRMDADDICFPERIEKQLNYLEQNRTIDLVAASVLTFDTQGMLKGVTNVPARHEEICNKPWNGFHFPHPTWFGRIKWFRNNRYSSSADGAEDQLLLYATYESSVFAGMQEIMLAYRDDRTSFKKLLGRRKSFWHAIAGYALRKSRIKDLLLISVVQPLKITADFLHVNFGGSQLRNKQLPVDRDTRASWEQLLLNIKKISTEHETLKSIDTSAMN